VPSPDGARRPARRVSRHGGKRPGASIKSPGRAAKPKGLAFDPFGPRIGPKPVAVPSARSSRPKPFLPSRRTARGRSRIRSGSDHRTEQAPFGSPFGGSVTLLRASGPTGLLYEACQPCKSMGQARSVRIAAASSATLAFRVPCILLEEKAFPAWAVASGLSPKGSASATPRTCHGQPIRKSIIHLWIMRITGVTLRPRPAAPAPRAASCLGRAFKRESARVAVRRSQPLRHRRAPHKGCGRCTSP
jgi:hypothetical protein